MGERSTLRLAREVKRLWIKSKHEVVHLDLEKEVVAAETLGPYLVHEDGEMRVPVLVCGESLVRGFLPEVYGRVLSDCIEGPAA